MRFVLLALVIAAFGPFGTVARAETVKIGIIKTTASGPIFVADAKGYFAAEDITVDLVYFDSGQPISVAVASGDIDFGSVGFTGGFYSLASQGVLKIVTAGVSEISGAITRLSSPRTRLGMPASGRSRTCPAIVSR